MKKILTVLKGVRFPMNAPDTYSREINLKVLPIQQTGFNDNALVVHQVGITRDQGQR